MQTKAKVKIETKWVPAEPCVLMRAKRRKEELPAFFAAAYGKLYRYAGGKTRPKACFGRYYDWSKELVDCDAGVVTSDRIPGEGDIEAGQYGGHDALYALTVGPYTLLEEVYGEMQAYLREHSLETAGAPYEVYLNSPEDVPESALRTEVYWPIR
jgi:effector-binding domain-containing protein